MKKLITLLLTGLLSFSLVACGEGKQTKEDGNKSSKTESGLPELKLNEDFEVKTENGDYTLKIEGIRKTDKRNEYEKKVVESVIFLDYTYINTSFKGINDKLIIDAYAFTLMDDEGNVLTPYPVSDNNREIVAVPVGGKCVATAAYGVQTKTTNIKVQFERNGKAVAEGTIKVE